MVLQIRLMPTKFAISLFNTLMDRTILCDADEVVGYFLAAGVGSNRVML